MGRRCQSPSCDPAHHSPGRVRVFLFWIGGERVAIALCEPCAERERAHEAYDVRTLSAA